MSDENLKEKANAALHAQNGVAEVTLYDNAIMNARSDTADGLQVLRVDSDLHNAAQTDGFVSAVEGQTKSVAGIPDSWELFQKRGNELFVVGKYELAIVAYSYAIELKRNVAPKELSDLHANRAAANLGAERFIDAFRDCQVALCLEPDHLKAAFRMAKAQAQLGKYEAAKEILEKSPHTTTPTFRAEISRLRRLIREKQSGDYDLKSLLKEAAASKTLGLDHAEYNGGVRKQWISAQKGNGLVALRDFGPGDLLFVSKAFAVAHEPEMVGGFALKCGETTVHSPSFNACVSRIIRRISNNAELAKELYQLYAGLNFERFGDAESFASCAIDPKRVVAIVEQNGFARMVFRAALAAGGPSQSPGDCVVYGGVGVWILASFMNHSCVPNTDMAYVGDLMIARAAKRICKGEELTTQYTDGTGDYATRQQELEKYGFMCNCELCVCDLKRAADQPDLHSQREAFMGSFEALWGRVQESVNRGQPIPPAKVAEDVSKLTKEFSRRVAYKDRFDPGLEHLCVGLASGYSAQKQWLKAAEAYKLAYVAMFGSGTHPCSTFPGSMLCAGGLTICFNIAHNYLCGSNLVKAKEYFQKMRLIAKESLGSADEELLKMIYPGLPLKNLFDSLS